MTRIHRAFALLGYSVASLIAACILLESFSYLVFALRKTPQEEGDIRLSPAYDGYAWAPTFLKEELRRFHQHHGTYQPFRIWGMAEWRGTYVNIDESSYGTVRRTINARPPRCADTSDRHIKVWVFGGSTVLGSGVPDFATLPSYLSQYLNAESHLCYEVINLGVEGYVTNQEILLLNEKLKQKLRPDVAVFYDGVNDAYVGAISPGDPLAHANLEEIKERVEGSWLSRLDFIVNSNSFRLVSSLIRKSQPARRRRRTDSQTAALAKTTLDNYEENLHQIEAISQAHKFRALHFWQPAFVFGNKPLVPFEQDLLNKRKVDPRGFAQAMLAVYKLAEQRAPTTHFIFLGHIFDRVSKPLYLDGWMHLGPLGNDIVAQRLAKEIKMSLESSVSPLQAEYVGGAK